MPTFDLISADMEEYLKSKQRVSQCVLQLSCGANASQLKLLSQWLSEFCCYSTETAAATTYGFNGWSFTYIFSYG